MAVTCRTGGYLTSTCPPSPYRSGAARVMLESGKGAKQMQFDMGFGAFAVVIIAALVVGVLVQMYLNPKSAYEWLIAGIAVGVGGWLASEITWTQWFTGLTNLGPQWDGLLIIPAVIGGLVLGAIVMVVARMVEAPEGRTTTA